MNRAALTVAALAAASACVAPEPQEAQRVTVRIADGPVIHTTADQAVAALMRRATWVSDPGLPDLSGGAWVHLSGGMRALFTDHAVLVDRGERGWRADLHLVGYGREGAVRPVADPVVDAWDTRVTLDRGPVVEWYDNHGDVLEQGFDLLQPPRAGAGEVVLDLALRGDLRAVADGRDLSLVDADGVPAVHMRQLVVRDRQGRALPASMTPDCEGDDCRIAITFDDTGATWPIHVDPVLQTLLGAPATFGAPGYGGWSVDASGNRVIVGVPGDPASTTVSTGYAVVLVRNGVSGTTAESWEIEATLAPTPGLNSFGRSVAISGLHAAVGAPQAGQVRVYVRESGTWLQSATLTRSGEGFGARVMLDGTRLAVAAPMGGDGATTSSLYVYPSVYAPAFAQLTSLVPYGDSLDDASVAMDADLCIVAFPDRADSGEYHVYWQEDGTGDYVELFMDENNPDIPPGFGRTMDAGDGLLVASVSDHPTWGSGVAVLPLDHDPNSAAPFTIDTFIPAPQGAVEFGTRLATDGRYVAVSSLLTTDASTGRVWLYDVDQPMGTIDVPASQWAPSVAIRDNLLVVGAPEDGSTGSVRVYRLDGSTWIEDSFAPTDGVNPAASSTRIGEAVAVEGRWMAVGMPADDLLGNDAGRVLMLEQTDPPLWPTTGRVLTEPTPTAGSGFGGTLAIDSEHVAVGAYRRSDGGAAYLFDLDGGALMFQAAGASPGAKVGRSMALEEAVWVVGIPGSPGRRSTRGSSAPGSRWCSTTSPEPAARCPGRRGTWAARSP